MQRRPVRSRCQRSWAIAGPLPSRNRCLRAVERWRRSTRWHLIRSNICRRRFRELEPKTPENWLAIKTWHHSAFTNQCLAFESNTFLCFWDVPKITLNVITVKLPTNKSRRLTSISLCWFSSAFWARKWLRGIAAVVVSYLAQWEFLEERLRLVGHAEFEVRSNFYIGSRELGCN